MLHPEKKYFTSIDVTFFKNQAYYLCNLSLGESLCDSKFKNQVFFPLNGLNFNNVNAKLNLEVSNSISNSEISNKETYFWEFFWDPCPQNMKHFKEVLNSKLQQLDLSEVEKEKTSSPNLQKIETLQTFINLVMMSPKLL